MERELQQVITQVWIDDVNAGKEGGDALCLLLLFAPKACPEILTEWAQDLNGGM